MSEKLKLLIVEDEQAIVRGLSDLFVFHGYEVAFAMDGLEGLEMAISGEYALVLLDVMLPSLDGFNVCDKIREHDLNQPIIMLTAKTSEEDIITGLSLGADDYIAKPFSVRELVLRVESVLKRSRKLKKQPDYLVVGSTIKIDVANLMGKWDDQADAPLAFTRREVEMLQYLQGNSDRPVSREELLEQIWGYDKAAHIETRTVDIHVAKLRRKIEIDSKNPQFLVTVRGEGYKLLSALEA